MSSLSKLSRRGLVKWGLASAGLPLVSKLLGGTPALARPEPQRKMKPGEGAVAFPGQVGGQDMFGAYEVVKGWPDSVSTLPGNEHWTGGAGQSVFAENPDRVFMLFRGELPNIKEPARRLLPEFGPSIQFPIGRLPWRDATASSPPGAWTAGVAPEARPAVAWMGKMGVDAKWAHCMSVANSQGKITETWTQWDHIFKRPHFVAINPYDPEKHVWVVDDFMCAIYKFSHDGKKLMQTLGTPGHWGADATHFNRPTFLAWLPDSTLFVSDGYNGTRVVKFDKNGKFLKTWGKPSWNWQTRKNIAGLGNPPPPNYFKNVHGIAVDPETRRVFVNDRGNHRVQVFDDNGKYLYDWHIADSPSDVHLIYIGADRNLWAFDRGTSKMLKYDLDGHFLYAWGTWGDFPGGFWGVHGMSVDQDGNFYVAEVDNGRVQKFRPRVGADPNFLVSKPVYSAWK